MNEAGTGHWKRQASRMRRRIPLFVVLGGALVSPMLSRAAAPPGRAGAQAVVISGELRQWHKVVFTLDGPYARERDDDPNPFMDYALSIRFRHDSGGREYEVPGYFAADGDAANTSAESGNKWRVIFRPDRTGRWHYRVHFVQGKGAAVNPQAKTQPVKGLDGRTGEFVIGPGNKTGRDLRAKGRLEYVGTRYLRFAGSGAYFLKEGADAPENFLAYADFDGDFKSDSIKDNLVKTWAAHVRDWRPGDPTWAGGRGKGIIGAVNYLASKGMNAISMLTMNIDGDDRNVFPYVNYRDRTHMDCSKLAQWEIVFDHAEHMGIFLHFKTQETENECLLDNGDTGPQRRLYYRELIARFGHHLALNWNLGEENGRWTRGKKRYQTTAQRLAMGRFFQQHDPYHNPIVVHNGQPPYDLLGPESPLTGFSLQTNNPKFIHVHRRVLEWIERSRKAGKPWTVACDEPGDAQHALVPDADDPNHADARMNALWGALLAGGWGCEWYFGYKHAHSDLTCQDWRSRDKWWDQCRIALEFFRRHRIPVLDMENADALVGNPKHENTVYCLARPGAVYVIHIRPGVEALLDLTGVSGTYAVRWYDPSRGGPLQTGSIAEVRGGAKRVLGSPPSMPDQDWVILVRARE